MLLIVGCGGGRQPEREQAVRGNGFVFAAPAEWTVVRASRQVTAAPEPDGDTLVAVSIFRLVNAYGPELWPAVVPELDGVAHKLAARQRATVEASRTVHVLGRRSRQYDLALSRDGRALKQRVTFFLFRRREFQLLCRWRASDGEPAACGLLVRRFKPAGFG